MALYTNEALESMGKKVELIGSLLRATDNTLEMEVTNELDITGNVIYVDFKILNEFKKIAAKKTMKMSDIVELYHGWAERVFFIAINNPGRLKKGKLRDHVAQAKEIVATISKIIPG